MVDSLRNAQESYDVLQFKADPGSKSYAGI